MEVILDSNFIISCLKRKIDFVENLEEMGFKILLPREVFQELKDLRLKVTTEERSLIDVALELFTKKKIKKMTLGGKNVDEGLILKGRDGYYIATLDNAIRRVVPNIVVIDSARNKLMIERK